MFSSTVLLFLLGATIASSQFIPKLSMLPSGCPPAPELAPMICKLTQNIGLQYKPQLIAPSTYIPPLVVEKCDTPQLQMEINLPLTIEKKPIVIPAPPVLPPITLPKFPVPVMIEKPIAPPVPIVEPCEPVLIPEMPVLNIPFPPALTPQDLKPMVIPQAPELPMFVMPELPVRVPEPAMIVEPCPEDQPMQVVPVPEYVKPLVPIPAAPVTLPELPAHVEIPSQPILPPMTIGQLVEEPCINEEVVVAQPLAPIPAAPELPPARLPELPVRVEVPNQPIFPSMIIEKPVDEPCITGEVVVAQPLLPIPAGPELPPARLPELPVQVEIPSQPILPPMIIEQSFEEPCITGEVVPQPLAPLPVAPKLPIRVEISTKPIPPPMIVERPIEEPCITGELVVARPEPTLLPQPPKVPQFITPEPQMEIMKPMAMPIFPAFPQSAVIVDPCEPSGQPIVKMTNLPPYFVKHLPSHVSINNKKFKEYVLPTMAINGFRPMERYYVHRA